MMQSVLGLVSFCFLLHLVHHTTAQTLVDTTGIVIRTFNPNTNSFDTCQSSGAGDYYNPTSFSCMTCGTNQIPDRSVTDGLGNYVQCRCAPGFYTTANDCSNDVSGNCAGFTCSSCLVSGKVAYSDNSACVSFNSSAIGIVMGDCSCPSGLVLQESDKYGNKETSKSCHTCPIGTAVVQKDMIISGKQYYGSLYLCQSCPDPLMSMTLGNVCTCPNGYSITGVSTIGPQSCVLTSLAVSYLKLENIAINIKYNDIGITVLSSTISHYFIKAATHCQYFGGSKDIQSCNILANLCALQLYDDQSTVCSTYLSIIASRGAVYIDNVANWVTGMPWLYYSGSSTACFDSGVDRTVTLRNDNLEYVLGTFTMNGTFLGYQPLGTLFTYCGRVGPYSSTGGGTSSTSDYQIFAHVTNNNYTCDLTTLYGKQQLFYELYLRGATFYPVPVRVVNLRSGVSGNQPNNLRPINNLCDGTDVLVRRFFLVDLISGLTADSATGGLPQVMRYASQISLEVSQRTSNSGTIYPPVLTIQYTEVQPPGKSTTLALVSYQVQGRYTMNLSSFFTTLFGFFIAGVVLTGLLFIISYINWNKRNARSLALTVSTTSIGGLNGKILIQLTIILLHSWVIIFFPFTVLVAWYSFVFFKLQSYPAILLPPMDSIYSLSSPYYPFTVMLHVLTFFQFTYVCFIVHRQINADIFFLDWEPSKNKVGERKTNVSVWRTILVANEYAEMQTKRKTDIKFTLFFIVLILIGLKYQFNATQQPDVLNLSDGQQNVLLRFAETTFWWIIFTLGQYLWKFLIYERYIGEPPEQVFVDFCTIAKISILVLDEKYHGYYLHCRSPHQYADGTMGELVDMLHKEEAGLTVDRSLEGAPSDVQSFELFVTGEWRTDFDSIYQKLIQLPSFAEIVSGTKNRNQKNTNNIPSGTSGGTMSNAFRGGKNKAKKGGGSVHPTERVLKAWKELAVFLQEFVENNFGRPALRRIVREQTYSERILGTPPDLSSVEQPCVLFPDRNFDYCKMLFLGREMDLLLLNILSYSMFDFWLNNTASAVFLCYLLDCAICYVRKKMGQAVIAKKTLIDQRFLF